MKVSLTLLLIAAVGGGSTLLVRSTLTSNSPDTIPDETLFVVQRGKLIVTVTENGSLMAKKSEKITPQGKRGGKITFLVEEGKTVEADEILCKLDTTELEAEVQTLELDIMKTTADLDTARTELDIQQTENVANIEKAQLALTKADKGLEKYEQGDARRERSKRHIALQDADVKHSLAKQKYGDSRSLFEHGYLTETQVKRDKIEADQAKAQFEFAEDDIKLFNEYTHPMTLMEKKAALKDAKRTLETAHKRAKSRLRQKEVGVESNEMRLDSLKKKLEDVQEEIEHCTLKSPSPGIVIYGDPNQPWYRDNIKLGGQIWSGFTLFTIPDLRVMQVQLKIHEADINKIKKEQLATVTMDTYPGLVLQGKVSKIAAVAGGRGWRDANEVKRFTVDITLDSTGGLELKPGISAKAVTFIEERQDVLYVPLQCVYLEGGTHYSYVMGDDGKPTQVTVKAGISNDTYIEIVEGLDEGERVLLYNPTIGANRKAAPVEPESVSAPADTPSTPPAHTGP